MMDRAVLRNEAEHYRYLAGQLLESFGELDDDTLRDTLQGISHFPDMIEEIIRSALEDDILITGLKGRIGDMEARLDRIQQSQRRKREMACWAMGAAALDKLKCPDFSVSYRMGQPKLEVVSEAVLPAEFLVPQPPRVDRVQLTAALKAGRSVEGATLVPGSPHIQVRTR